MFKKVLTLAAAAIFGFAANAQISDFPYTQGFENGLGNWTIVDADGDGFNWMLVSNNNESGNYSVNSGNYAIASESWTAAGESGIALTPDNWLISPAIALGEGLSLVWYDAAQDADYAAEHYSVLISTTDSLTASFTTSLADITISSADFTRHSVDLSAYNGQTVYIAFRHHECTDQFVMIIDDIAVMDDRAPIAAAEGPAYAYVGVAATFTGTMTSGLDQNVSYEWICTDATFDRTDSTVANATFAAAGTYTVQFAVHNDFGNDTVALTVEVLDCTAPNALPYAFQFNQDGTCWHGEGWETNTGYFGLWNADTAWLAVSWSTDDEGNFIDGVDNSLVSPLFTIPAEGQFELKYLVYPTSSGDHYSVIIRSEGNDDEVLFSENTPTDAEMYMRKLLIPASYSGTDIQVVFRHHDSDTTAVALAIAMPELRAVTAPEAAIVAPRSARTTDAVSLSATVASALDVTYAWTINGATPASATTDAVSASWAGAAEGSYAISLAVTNAAGTGNATASIYIFNCESTAEAPVSYGLDYGLGCWTAIDNDADGYSWNDIDEDFVAMGYEAGVGGQAFAKAGSSAIISWGNYPSYGWTYYSYFGLGEQRNADNVAYSPAIVVPQGQWHLNYFASSPLGDSPVYSVLVATSEPASISDFTEVRAARQLDVNRAGEDYYTEGNIDLSAYAGQTIWIAFRHQDATGASGLLIDEVALVQGAAPAGIGDVNDAEVSVYPNPAADYITVAAEGVSRVQVLDAAGRVVVEGTEAGRYDIGSLAAGSYLVRVVCAEGVATRRIVKM